MKTSSRRMRPGADPFERRTLSDRKAGISCNAMWRATWALYGWALLAAAPVLAEPSAPTWRLLAEAGIWWLAAAGAAAWLSGWAARDGRIVSLTVGWAFAAPHVLEPLLRAVFGVGRPLEVRLLATLVDLGLAGLILGKPKDAWRAASSSVESAGRRAPGPSDAERVFDRFLACSAATSLFVLVFASTLGSPAWTRGASAGYAFAGAVWLSTAFWRRCDWTSLAGPRDRAGWAVQAVLGALLAAGAWGGGGGSRGGPGAAAEWISASGGTGGFDPYARGGVNDGDQAVAAKKNPLTVGDVQTDLFLDSPRPSLYDLYNETTGEPRPPKENRRAVGLPWQPTAERPEPIARQDRPTREFSTLREAPDEARTPKDVDADALVYVRGPAPWHLRVEVFERFDGATWRSFEEYDPHPALEPESAARDWMRTPIGFRTPEDSLRQWRSVAVGLHASPRIPTPEGLIGLRIAKVDQPSFYAWAQEEVLSLFDIPEIPSATSIEMETVDARRSDDFRGSVHALRLREELFEVPVGSAEARRTERLAAAWTEGEARGWPQIEAVERRLKEEFRLESALRGPADQDDAVGAFLHRDRRGPSYLFASSAAILLRWAGYPTRLASGYYVRPDRYEFVSGSTPVHKQDLHFWAEVLLPSGRWAIVEATPGFHRAPPPSTWLEKAAACTAWCGRAILRWGPAGVALAALGLLAFRMRRRLFDLAAALRWSRAVRRADAAAALLATARLLDGRALGAGRARPASWTFRRWADVQSRACSRIAQEEVAATEARAHAGVGSVELERARRSAAEVGCAASDWRWLAQRHQELVFGPPGGDFPYSADEVRAVCVRLEKVLSFDRFAKLPPIETSPPAALRAARGSVAAEPRRPLIPNAVRLVFMMPFRSATRVGSAR